LDNAFRKKFVHRIPSRICHPSNVPLDLHHFHWKGVEPKNNYWFNAIVEFLASIVQETPLCTNTTWSLVPIPYSCHFQQDGHVCWSILLFLERCLVYGQHNTYNMCSFHIERRNTTKYANNWVNSKCNDELIYIGNLNKITHPNNFIANTFAHELLTSVILTT